MPWPWALANWLYDPTASALSGKAQFRLPYPRPLLSEELAWNGFLLEAMRLVVRAYEIFSRPAESWGPAENEFYKWMIEGADEGGLRKRDGE